MSTINEKKMTGAEKKKREKIVKGMKKSLPYMKKKYGKRAKDVMYATATKQAMKESFDSLVEKLLSETYQFKKEA
ncbi:hypothetical protein EBR43_10925 [bacterium]|jgi:hypothetical protein|nr:hypothetical protein [bacterium]